MSCKYPTYHWAAGRPKTPVCVRCSAGDARALERLDGCQASSFKNSNNNDDY